MAAIIIAILRQLLAQSPLLLVYLIAIVLALVFWRRSPTPSVLVFLGAVLLLVITVAHASAFQYLVGIRPPWVGDSRRLGRVLTTLNLLSTLIQACGLALVVAAAFVGRRDQTNSEKATL